MKVFWFLIFIKYLELILIIFIALLIINKSLTSPLNCGLFCAYFLRSYDRNMIESETEKELIYVVTLYTSCIDIMCSDIFT
jgi:hypothetical protein